MLDQYDSTEWMEEAIAEKRGISGVWFPRKLSSGVDVLSYMLPLNSLSTTTSGTIVVNLRESQMGDYLSSSEQGEHDYLLMTQMALLFHMIIRNCCSPMAASSHSFKKY